MAGISGMWMLVPFAVINFLVERNVVTDCAVFIGIIGDIKKRKYVPLAALCLIIPAALTTLLPLGGQFYYLNMSIFYAALGAELGYVHLMFWDIAPRTAHPGLWAGMGRIMMGIAEIMSAGLAISTMPDIAVMGAELVMIVLIVIVMAFNGNLDIAGIAEIPDQVLSEQMLSGQMEADQMFSDQTLSDQASAEQEMSSQKSVFGTMEEYRTLYGLTPKESEVLQKLITTESSLQEIADEMAITRRVLQKHITALYAKTGTKTRIGLLQHYTLFLTEGPGENPVQDPNPNSDPGISVTQED